jgi:hypothetical protein
MLPLVMGFAKSPTHPTADRCRASKRHARRLPETPQNCYFSDMTVLLEQAVESVRDLPAETQDALARLLLQFAGIDQSPLELSAEDAASFDDSLAQADRGEFATDEQVRAIWAKHGL